MMDLKLFHKIIIIKVLIVVLIVNDEVCCKNNQDATNIPECIVSFIENTLPSRYYREFIQFYDGINKSNCKVDSNDLRTYLLTILKKENLDTQYTRIESMKYDGIFGLLVSKTGWNKDVENELNRRANIYKKKRQNIYYNYLTTLIERSTNWYDYIYIMYKNDIDSLSSGGRRGIYRTIIERFKDSFDRSTKIKVESILYAILSKDYYSFNVIDKYLVSINSVYINSKQRLQICKRTHEYFKNNPVVSKSPYYEYVSKVLEEFNKSKKTLTEYSPPFVVY